MTIPTLPNAPTILCVDDDLSGLRFRQLILEAKGYHVLCVTSAEEGLEVFQSTPIDLVVTDHLIGRAMGTATAAAVKRLRPNVPVIILGQRATREFHGSCGGHHGAQAGRDEAAGERKAE